MPGLKCTSKTSHLIEVVVTNAFCIRADSLPEKFLQVCRNGNTQLWKRAESSNVLNVLKLRIATLVLCWR